SSLIISHSSLVTRHLFVYHLTLTHLCQWIRIYWSIGRRCTNITFLISSRRGRAFGNGGQEHNGGPDTVKGILRCDKGRRGVADQCPYFAVLAREYPESRTAEDAKAAAAPPRDH